MGAPEVFLKSPSRGRSREGEKIKSSGRKLLIPQGVDHGRTENIRVSEKNHSFVTSILMPQPDSASERGIKSDATRQKYALFFFRGSETEPIPCPDHHEAPIRSQISYENSSHSLTATLRAKKRHRI